MKLLLVLILISILISGCSQQQIDERLIDQTANTAEMLKEKLIELAGKRGFNQEIVYELFKDLKDRIILANLVRICGVIIFYLL